ncbi:MAG: metallophosphoesterase [Ignavibacteria bacterium]|nr:metallophosphoesterase [Ignavibacteria bacterium]
MKRSFLAVLIIVIFTLTGFSQSLNFITFGDWGREGMHGQKETADAMGTYAAVHNTKFILLLGDNFYPTGVKSADDNHWKVSFEDVYTAPSLQVPWHVAIGNHDYGGNVQAQIDYSSISSRWKLPARYYSFTQKIDENTEAIFVIIDSNPFIKSYLAMDKENGELDSNSVLELRKQNADAQLKWLDSVLSSSNAKWKIVAGHHPVYSGGEHGNTQELIDLVNPILINNKVNLYLAGHDHDMQHLKTGDSQVNYFVSGAGSKLRKTGKTEFTQFSASENGFLNISLSIDNIKCDFIGVDGNVLYGYEVR